MNYVNNDGFESYASSVPYCLMRSLFRPDTSTALQARVTLANPKLRILSSTQLKSVRNKSKVYCIEKLKYTRAIQCIIKSTQSMPYASRKLESLHISSI